MYQDPKTSATIDIEWMVAYITAYPLDEDDACDTFTAHVLERRRQHRHAVVKQNVDPSAPAMSGMIKQIQTALHQSPCRQHRMLKLDVDTKDPELLEQLYLALVGIKLVLAAETHGGYHVVIERGPACQSLWKFARSTNAGVNVADQWITIEDNSGPMIAIPGTNQGGFTVRLVTEQWVESLRRAAAAEESVCVS